MTESDVLISQNPLPGTHRIFYRGDVCRFTLTLSLPCKGSAFIRTTLLEGKKQRLEIIERVEMLKSVPASDWHDMEMQRVSDTKFEAVLPILEIGRFEAKTYFLPDGSQIPLWPAGENLVIKVEPADCVCGNTIYTAFVRQFGPHIQQRQKSLGNDRAVQTLESSGYTVIPMSGTFRNLGKHLDLIITTLRSRIIHLLPIHPTPTTYARMGRFGSPFAALDFFDVDSALAEFDRRTTPLEQFDELVDGIHQRAGRVFLDIPVNHTGWASRLQLEHPEWFVRDDADRFQSPGAWGVTWEDLSELDYGHSELWQYMARVFLFWCSRGVDGFRCDAGYKVPYSAWEYIVAKVRNEYPDTIFLLEGLGGRLKTTEDLLMGANLDWAYSELFQNYDRSDVEACLGYCIDSFAKVGTLVHFAETHDNNRLAVKSHGHARLRTALAALCSDAGAFGIANGVEWFAEEKIDVHGAPSLHWNNPDNMVDYIRRLNTLLFSHSSFRGGTAVRIINSGHANTLALVRGHKDEDASLLIVANLDESHSGDVVFSLNDYPFDGIAWDLLSGKEVNLQRKDDSIIISLDAGDILCLSRRREYLDALEKALLSDDVLLNAEDNQCARAKALDVYCMNHSSADLSNIDIELLVQNLQADPYAYCGKMTRVGDSLSPSDSEQAVVFSPVTTWEWPHDTRRTVMIPPNHILLVRAPHRFSVLLREGDVTLNSEKSILGKNGMYFVLLLPSESVVAPKRRSLMIDVFSEKGCQKSCSDILYLPSLTNVTESRTILPKDARREESCVLLTNDRGAMAQVRTAWGEIKSQYDALLAGNMDSECPSDRRVMLTRCRAWLVCKGYYQDIDVSCLNGVFIDKNESAQWSFSVQTGNGMLVDLEFGLRMIKNRNAVQLVFQRKNAENIEARRPDVDPVELIFRLDIEDRINHEKTKAWVGPQSSWSAAVDSRDKGFVFHSTEAGHRLEVGITHGKFMQEPEWVYNVQHSEESNRGLGGFSDLFSPGYFTVALNGGGETVLTAAILCGEDQLPDEPILKNISQSSLFGFDEALRNAIPAFIVKRNNWKTVIAGYPWFLDWGRDTLICLRGMIAAGFVDESAEILKQFAAFESNGTLPNMIRGKDVSDRDTSDAPLWFMVACSDLIKALNSHDFLSEDCGGRSLRDVLLSIVMHYKNGTRNGIKMDDDTGLIFSPSHFTWMDTNYPAGTPRQGYPIEIQALWFAALKFVAELDDKSGWMELSEKVRASVLRLYPVKSFGEVYLGDCLHAHRGQSAEDAICDDALRPNQLFAITLGCVKEQLLQAGMLRACEKLLVPGAIRSLADQPVSLPLRVDHDGVLLNDPQLPYWGHYAGDEDTRRKPAYHNGTAWCWQFPAYCEALKMTYGEMARDTALSLLGSCSDAFYRGCFGQMPEIMDGDNPHNLKGCSAQAWSVTEAYRVMRDS